MQLNFARPSEDRRLHIRIELVNRRNPRIALRLAQSGDFQFPSGNELRWKLGPKTRQTLFFEESFQFVRRSGKQNEDSLSAFILAAHPLSGSAAVGVGQNGCTRDDIRLLEIICRHLPAAGREALFETGNNLWVAVKFKSERVADCFAREIVFCRAQAAHEDDDLGARYRKTGGSRQTFSVIADDGFEDDFNAKLVELFR